MIPPPQGDVLVSIASLDVEHHAEPLRVHIVRTRRPHIATVLFSHGAGLAGASYAPLFQLWARHGLAVVAPDHPQSAAPLWHTRILDMQALWRDIAGIERQLSPPACRLGHGLPRVAGHSFGGHTAAILLGARPRIATPSHGNLRLDQAASGILLAPPGNGGPENLTPEWLARAPYLDMDWSGLDRPTMTVAGTLDNSALSTRDWQWHTSAFQHAPAGNKVLAVAADADHYLGGIAVDRGTPQPALLTEIAAVTAGYLLNPRIAPRPATLRVCTG